ncbi:MAG: SDR family oxidoreductase [Firmicutes bacterium]|nr:SDR family oxidoreductase [Bacillota bacterium]
MKGGLEVDNPFSLSGKIVLVTGASSGIGRATSIVLSKLGARVILSGRRNPALEETRSMMENRELHFIEPYDLSEVDGIPSWIKGVSEKVGRPLDGLVHCAGISRILPIRAMSSKNVDSMMIPNLDAAMLLLKGGAAKGVAADGASFVFVSSVAGLSGSPGLVAYSASKGGLVAMVRAAARELAARSIRVNAIAPGMVETPMHEQHAQIGASNFESSIARHPLGLGKPEDIAYGIAYLLSPAARWVTGITLVIDGGYLS